MLTTRRDHRSFSRQKFSWIPFVIVCFPSLVGAENLLSVASGASIVHRTTETEAAPAAGLLDTAGPATPWISAEGDSVQTVTFRLRSNLPFNTASINPAGSSEPEHWAKSIALATADPYPHMGGWRHVASLELEAKDTLQTFSFPRIRGRYIRLSVHRAQGASANQFSVAEVELSLR